MKISLKKILICMLCLLTLGNVADIKADTYISAEIVSISKYGNLHIDISMEELNAAGIEIGDVVDVKINEKLIEDIPVAYNYQNVAFGKPIVVKDDEEINIAINNGDFASTYGIARKVKTEDSFYWEITNDSTVEISLKKKGVYTFYDLSYSKNREDYVDATDEQFANFRALKTSNLKENLIYRGSSPIDDQRGRAEYADEALEKYDIRNIINLANTENEAYEFVGFEDTYCSKQNILYATMGAQNDYEEFYKIIKDIFEYIADNDGPFYIHCLEGKDRCGNVSTIIEAYAGASYQELIDDYMLSFINYYDIEEDSEIYRQIAENYKNMLKELFEIEDVENNDYRESCKRILNEIGVSRQTLKKLDDKLLIRQETNHYSYVLVSAAFVVLFALMKMKNRNRNI